jgi:hypothetical protein
VAYLNRATRTRSRSEKKSLTALMSYLRGEPREAGMGNGALIARNNSGRNVLALRKQGEKDLIVLAIRYSATQVA